MNRRDLSLRLADALDGTDFNDATTEELTALIVLTERIAEKTARRTSASDVLQLVRR